MSGLAPLLLAISLTSITDLPSDGYDAQLAKCASIADDASRLACFDAYAAVVAKPDNSGPGPVGGKAVTAAPAAAASSSPDARPADAERATGSAEASSRTGSPGQLEGVSAAPETADAQVARIKTFIRLNRSKRIRITLDNGQVWQEIDGAPFRGNVQPGTEVTITERRFGGHKMTVPTRSAAIFVRRIK